MTTGNIKVAGLIEFPVYRMGIEEILKRISGIDYVGSTDFKNVKQFLKEYTTDILLVHTRKKNEFNRNLFQSIRALFKDLKIVFFLNTTSKEEIRQYRGFALNGLLLKSLSIRELEYALKTIYEKGFYLSQGIPEDAFDYFLKEEETDSDKHYEKLTKREHQIMMMIYHEFTTHEIAEQLKISRRTVEGHRIKIMSKIGVRNNIGIVKFIAKFGS